MILVDTSVWIDHFRAGRPDLQELLEDGRAHCHPFVIGELACGLLKNRAEVIRHLGLLPSVEPADNGEAMHLLEARKIAGRGISWIDVHLLASALISHADIWTLDQRLAAAARELRVAAHVR